MCEIKTVKILAVLLLAATGFCIYQVNSEKKVGHHSESITENPCENSTKSVVWTVASATI